jgi:hypothetical protein
VDRLEISEGARSYRGWRQRLEASIIHEAFEFSFWGVTGVRALGSALEEFAGPRMIAQRALSLVEEANDC